jgi:hypothetical protein
MGMPDLILPIEAQVRANTSDFDRSLAQIQARLERVFARVPEIKQQGNLGAQIAYLNRLSPQDAGTLLGRNPALVPAINAANRLAVTGQAPLLDQQTLQARRLELQLLRQANQQRQQNLRGVQQAAQAYSIAQTAAAFAFGGHGMARQTLAGMAFRTFGALAGLGTTPAAGGAGGTGGTGAGSAQQPGSGGAGGALGAGASSAAATGIAGVLKDMGSNVAGALGKNAGPLAALAALGLLGNEITSGIAANEQYLQANADRTRGDTLFGRTLQTAQRYWLSPADTTRLYEQLGRAGVQGPAVQGLASVAAAFSRISGLDLTSVGQMAGRLNVGAGLSPETIGRLFDAIVQGANRLGLSMTTLTDDLDGFTKATNQTALGLRGEMSVLAAQGVLGQTIPIATAAPLQNAIGTQAYRLAGATGMTVDQLQQLQTGGGGGIATLMDRYNQFLRRSTGGTLAQRIEQASVINQAIGGYNVAGLGLSEQQRLFRLALTGDPRRFEQAYQQLLKQTTPSAQQLRAQGQAVAGAITPISDKAGLEAQQIGNQWLKRIAQDMDQLARNAEQAKNQPGAMLPSLPGDIGAFLGGVLQSMLPQNWLGDFFRSPLGGTSLPNAIIDALNAILGTSIGHAAPAGGTVVPTPVGPNNQPTPGAPTNALPQWAPSRPLDTQRQGIALALNKAMPRIPWQVFYAWAQAEGANAAYNNPLNIMYAPKDPNLSTYGEQYAFTSTGQGATQIGRFPTMAKGAAATAALLRNEYPAIMQAAATGDPTKLMQAIQASQWAPGGQYGHVLQDIFSENFKQITVKVDITDKTKNGITATQTGTTVGGGTPSRIGPATGTNPHRKPAGRPSPSEQHAPKSGPAYRKAQ